MGNVVMVRWKVKISAEIGVLDWAFIVVFNFSESR